MSLILRRVPAFVVAVGVAVAVAFALGWSPHRPGATTGGAAATSHSQRPALAAGGWDGGWTRHGSTAATRAARAAPTTRPVSTAGTPASSDTPTTRPVSTAGTRTSPATRTTASGAAGDSKSKGLAPPAMALLLVAGAVVGVVVGLVPAVLLAFLFGVRPPFRRRAEAEAAEPHLVAVPLLVPHVAPGADAAVVPDEPDEPEALDEPDVPEAPDADVPEAPLAGPGPVLVSMPAPGAGQAERPVPPSAPERHRALYDTEYARQLERLEALRQSIGAGVGRDTAWPSGRPREPRRNGNGPRPADPDQSTSRTPS
jgi:hypothetical protein